MWYNKARCYALQNNIESAIENLQQALNVCPQYLQIMQINSDFNKIRFDERFQALFQQPNY